VIAVVAVVDVVVVVVWEMVNECYRLQLAVTSPVEVSLCMLMKENLEAGR